jgi:hypothetical protein
MGFVAFSNAPGFARAGVVVIEFFNSENVLFLIVILLASTATGLLIARSSRGRILLLGIQYLGVFVMVNQSWPFELAVVKLVTGWIASTVIGLVVFSLSPEDGDVSSLPAGQFFLLLVVMLVLITAWSLTPAAMLWIPGVSQAQMTASLFLISLGLLQLGLTARPARTIIGLFTVLSGFEILYAAVERSVLVAGLLAGVTLGLAMTGAYLMVAPGIEADS